MNDNKIMSEVSKEDSDEVQVGVEGDSLEDKRDEAAGVDLGSDTSEMGRDEVKVPSSAEKVEEKVEERKRRRKGKIGMVVSNKMNKSIVVYVERKVQHAIYKKYFKKSAKFMVHDEKELANIGDKVEIREARPYSKRKSWRLFSIIERAK